jgi:hypothetical protein
MAIGLGVFVFLLEETIRNIFGRASSKNVNRIFVETLSVSMPIISTPYFHTPSVPLPHRHHHRTIAHLRAQLITARLQLSSQHEQHAAAMRAAVVSERAKWTEAENEHRKRADDARIAAKAAVDRASAEVERAKFEALQVLLLFSCCFRD